jgi:predicted RNA-binding Zn ribbon-like protein
MAQRDPAPGSLETIRRLVNTFDVEQNTDGLDSPHALKAFLLDVGLLGEAEPVTEDDLGRLRAVREALRSLMHANHGDELDPGAVPILNEAAARAKLTFTFDPSHACAMESVTAGVDGSIGRLLAIVYRAMVEGTWERMKACRRDSCQWGFYDRSKNHSSKWCSMEVCGNREKAQTYRRRHTAAS